jgi:hypothetical protein
MKRWSETSAPVLALLTGLVMACPATAESVMAHGAQAASARLTLRVVVPPMVRLQEDAHPAELASDVAQQKLVIQTNLRQGFCAALRLANDAHTGWTLRVASGDEVWLQPSGEGYRLCTKGPGLHTVHLEHRFDTPTTPDGVPRTWPVQTEIASL